jgi:hypothetical protein
LDSLIEMKRRRVKQSVTLLERLADEARRLKLAAEALPAGEERDELLRKAAQAKAAVEMTGLLEYRPASK